jgi:hypothetical protein
MKNEKVKQLITEKDLKLEQVLDAIIELNGLVGVGLITLGDDIKTYLHSKITEQNRGKI